MDAGLLPCASRRLPMRTKHRWGEARSRGTATAPHHAPNASRCFAAGGAAWSPIRRGIGAEPWHNEHRRFSTRLPTDASGWRSSTRMSIARLVLQPGQKTSSHGAPARTAALKGKALAHGPSGPGELVGPSRPGCLAHRVNGGRVAAGHPSLVLPEPPLPGRGRSKRCHVIVMMAAVHDPNRLRAQGQQSVRER
jgi:hypothetical protein